MNFKFTVIVGILIILALGGISCSASRQYYNVTTERISATRDVSDLPAEQDGSEESELLTAEYTLGPADVFEMRVWGYENLQQLITIPPDGIPTIFPVGKIKASGKTPTQLGEEITKRLEEYVKEVPSVTITVRKYTYYRIYVLGEVNNPGLYPFEGKLTVLEAVTIAGSPTRRAQVGKVQIARPDKDNPRVARIMFVNLSDITRKGEIAKDIALQPGDIVFIPSSIFSSINMILADIVPSIQFLYYVDSLTR
jgi:polysaccharide export outer membrane protein